MGDSVRKGERLLVGEGMAVWAADKPGGLILEFADEAVCEAAFRIQQLLERHAVPTGFVERLGSRILLARRLELLPVEVVIEAAPGQVDVAFRAGGRTLDRAEAESLLTPDRLERIEDLAAHAARSLRAHLSLRGIAHLRARLRFGLTEDGACLLQVVNPLECELGSTDMRQVAELLGG
ncbi:hypothetical protein J2Z79_002885 [Symbiobacterium terraclitae]|uniref:ATP-grasp domain-containing protein n=1 Tax=Symbiobacterium terraclitae TaxID=557451 RepID=A0ABS4JWT0_9FIRM|nr:hypothetical protein [Symbiobacterium terraclitae]MBP2019446.1 hypothetical protein [Symbiobacterium terraclitae]